MTRLEAAPSSTPTVRGALRRGTFWTVFAFILLLVVVAGVLINGATGRAGGALEADNPAPGGAMAVAEVLAQRGVDVRIVSRLEDAESAVAGDADTTVLFFDRDRLLTEEQLGRVSGLAGDLVLASPDLRTLTELAAGVRLAGDAVVEGVLKARCSESAAAAATTIPAEDTDTYRVNESALPRDAEVDACFPGDEDVYALVRIDVDGDTTTVVDGDPLLSNDGVLERGNAALALRLLGQNQSLVWYIPTQADVEATGPPSLGELTPGWVTPAIVLALVVTLAAGIWRGRRFGPLVIENLPVTVRASETVEGRARLYGRISARGRAIDALRMGAISRMATSLRLARTASVDEVVAAAASTTGMQPAAVHAILLGEMPSTDKDLVTLSDSLGTLEAAVKNAVDPTGSRNP